MIYIGNFRNLEDTLYTVVFNTGVESDSSTLSPSPFKEGNKYTIKLNKGFYSIENYYNVEVVNSSEDAIFLEKDNSIVYLAVLSDNQSVTFQGTEEDFYDLEFTQFRTKFLTLAFEEPVLVEYASDSSDIYKGAKYSKMTVNVINDKIYDDLFATRSNSVSAVLYKEGSIEWQGYLTPNIYSQDYAYSKNELSLECIDTIATLQYEPYKEKGTDAIEVKTFKALLNNCLRGRYEKVYYPLEFKSGKVLEGGGNGLPAGFTRLEYIRTDGKAYVDLPLDNRDFSDFFGKIGLGVESSFRADYRYIVPNMYRIDEPSAYFFGVYTDTTKFAAGIYERNGSGDALGNESWLGWVGPDCIRTYEEELYNNVPYYRRDRLFYNNDSIATLVRNGWDNNLKYYCILEYPNYYYNRVRLIKDTAATFKKINIVLNDSLSLTECNIFTGYQQIGDYKGNFFYAHNFITGQLREEQSEIPNLGGNPNYLRIFGFKPEGPKPRFISDLPTTNTDCEYFRVYSWGHLVIDLVPCIRQSDGQVGFYDLKSRQFFGNSNTEGTFIAGGVVENDSISDTLSTDTFDSYIGLDNLTISEKTWYKDSDKTWDKKKSIFESVLSYLGLTAIAKGKYLYLLDYEHLNINSQYQILDKDLNSTGETTYLNDVRVWDGSADDNTSISVLSPYSEVKVGINTKEYDNVIDKLYKTSKELIPGHIWEDSIETVRDNKTYTTIWNEVVLKSKYSKSYIWSPDKQEVWVPQSSDSYFKAFYELDPSINPQERVDVDEAIGYVSKLGDTTYENTTDTSHISKALDFNKSNSNVLHIIPFQHRDNPDNFGINRAPLIEINVVKDDLIVPSNAFLILNFDITFSTQTCYESNAGSSAPNQFKANSSQFNVPVIVKYGDYYYTNNGWQLGESFEDKTIPRTVNIPLSVEEASEDVFDTRYSVVNNVEYDTKIDADGFKIPLFTGETDVNDPADLTVTFVDFANPGYDGNQNKLAKSYIISGLSLEVLPSLKEEESIDDEEDKDDVIEVIDRTYVEEYNIDDFKIYSYNNKKAGYNTVYAFIDGSLYLLNTVYNETLNQIGNFEEFAVRKRVIQYSCPRKQVDQALFGEFNPYTKLRNEVIFGDLNFIIDESTIHYRTGIADLKLIEKR